MGKRECNLSMPWQHRTATNEDVTWVQCPVADDRLMPRDTLHRLHKRRGFTASPTSFFPTLISCDPAREA